MTRLTKILCNALLLSLVLFFVHVAVSILKGSDTAAVYTTVHITGAINRPGYYQLPRAARVFDAVQAAGGMTDAADDNAINLAERLRDDMKIVVPEKQAFR